MKIKINLKKDRYCNGCPCLHIENEIPDWCGLDYPINVDFVRKIRPQECIKKHGK